MSKHGAERAAAFDRLQREYRQFLVGAGEELRAFLVELRAGGLPPERLAELCQLAHRLSGSAGTYGYQDISTEAGRLESAIEQTGPGDEDIAILSLLAMLIESIRRAGSPEAVARPARAAQLRLADSGPAPALSRRRKLMIAEDDPAVAGLLSSLMQGEVDLLLAKDGEDALAQAARERPDLIILDDHLPGMSGLQVLAALQADPATRTVPVVMLTGNKDPANVVAAVNAGAVDYFTKPFEPIPLVNHIRSLLAHTTRHVLVVDDDRSVRELLIHRFEALGIQAAGAEDGVSALEMARTTRPDLIVLDRMIPGLEGGAVLLELKQDEATSEIPVIMLTARHTGGDAHAWLKRGAADFIPKPFDPDEVVLRAMRLLGIDDDED